MGWRDNYTPGQGGQPALGRRGGQGGRGGLAHLCPPARPWHRCGPAERAASPPGLCPRGQAPSIPITHSSLGSTHLSPRQSCITFVSLTRRESSLRDGAPSAAPSAAPGWCSWSGQGGATRLAGITGGPHRNNPWITSLPFSHPLLVSHLLPGNKGCLSVPHSTLSTWVQTQGCLRAGGFLATSSPCLMLYWDHYPSASWESPRVKLCFPYSHSCHSGQVCHPHQVCPGRKRKAVREALRLSTSQGCLGPTGASRCMEGGAGHRESPARWIQLGSTEGTRQDVSPGCSWLVLTGTPGGPRGPTGPGGPCSPRSPGSPCRERRWWEHRAAGHPSATASPASRECHWHSAGDRGEAWHRTLVPCKPDGRNTNLNLPSPEVLTSRPGSPCFPGSPCRQGRGEDRDIATLTKVRPP